MVTGESASLPLSRWESFRHLRRENVVSGISDWSSSRGEDRSVEAVLAVGRGLY